MRTFVIVLATVAGLGLSDGIVTMAQAQSLGAPAGTAPATAPGGTMGRAGPRNVRSAVRTGEAYRVNRRGRLKKVDPASR